jgi:hypothetical protein
MSVSQLRALITSSGHPKGFADCLEKSELRQRGREALTLSQGTQQGAGKHGQHGQQAEIKQVVGDLKVLAADSESSQAPGMHAEARNITHPVCPPGIDPEVFALLPEDI